jgi:hypothetical protein
VVSDDPRESSEESYYLEASNLKKYRTNSSFSSKSSLRFFRHVIHPIELFVDYDISATSWLRWIFADPAYQQCFLFMYFATADITQQRPPTPATLYHMQRTIRLLNESLSSPHRMVAVRDSTVAVVIILTIFSCMMGHGSGARAHIAGLQQIIRVRGGLHTFGSDVKLFMKEGVSESATRSGHIFFSCD